MRKTVFLTILVCLVLISFFFVPSVSAVEAGVKPVVTAQFTEQVILVSYSFKNTDSGKSYPAEFLGVVESQHKYSFTPAKALSNGNYDFILIAKDLVGNWKEYHYSFTVYVAETRILLTAPNSLGYSQFSPFNVTVFTSKPASCKYSGVKVDGFEDIRLKPFDITGNVSSGDLVSDHTIVGFSVEPDFPKRLYVVCSDDLGRDVFADFLLHTDPKPPTVTYSGFDPDPVSEYPETGPLSSTLKVVTDEPVICKYTSDANLSYEDMDPFPGFDENSLDAFKDTNEVVLTFPDDTVKDTFTYYFQCEDRSGRLTPKVKKDILVDLTVGLSIRVNSPPKFTSNTSVYLNITTNKRAYCMYKGSSPDPTSFTDPNAALGSDIDHLSRSHGKDLGSRSSGNYTVSILCNVPEGVGFEAQEKQISYTFVIDTVPPDAPAVSAVSPVCGNTLSATFNASDAESGIAEYHWAVGGDGLIYNNGSTSENSVSVSTFASGAPLNLSPEGAYIFSVSAVDNAGNEGPAGVSDTITFDDTGIACDHTPPKISINKSEFGQSATIECVDDKSGCSSLGSFYGTSYEEPCTADQYYLPPAVVPLFRSTIICYNISDTAGNRAVGSQLVTLNASTEPDTPKCPDGIDSDGDGYGERCPLGPDCDDTDPNISIGCPDGCIMDLDGDGYGIGCAKGNDCNGRDPDLTTDCPNGCISDNDGDEYGLGCANGPDCKGDDSTLQVSCPSGCFDDNDGEGYGINCPAGYDCNGEDADQMQSCDSLCIQDTDGDGFGPGCSQGLDCDGADPSLTVDCPDGCIFDEDGDGYGMGCSKGNDCSGLNPLVFESCPNGCIDDNDGDGFGWGCNAGADCNDTDPTVNIDCSSTTDCIYDHDGDGFGLGCNAGADCDDFDRAQSDQECSGNCTFDEDCNGLPDDWQLKYWNATVCADESSCGSAADPDQDGFSNIEEYRRGSDPLVKEEKEVPPVEVKEEKEDADEDGMPDACELKYGLDPSDPFDADADPDGDTLSNKFECTYVSGSCYGSWLDPHESDTDSDGYDDNVEIDEGFDPCDPDSHPSGSFIGILIFIFGFLLSLGSVGYLIYKKYYLLLISPPPSPKPAAAPAAARPAQSRRVPVSRRPIHHVPRVVHHPVQKPGPKHPLLSKDKFLEEARKRAEEREKIFSKFGGKHKHETPKEVMEHLAEKKAPAHHIRIPRHALHKGLVLKKRPKVVAKQVSEHGKPATKQAGKLADHVDSLAKVAPDYFKRISELSKHEEDYFNRLASIVEKKNIRMEDRYVDKLAKISKEVKRKKLEAKTVEKAFRKTDVDRLDEFLGSRKKVSTFLKEYAEKEVGRSKVPEKRSASVVSVRKDDDFARLEHLGAGKSDGFDALESLSHRKRSGLLEDLKDLSSEKAQNTALSNISVLSETSSKAEIFKTFKRISKEKHVDKDVFAVLLDYLLKSGKISKRDVSELLFKLEEDGILDKKAVSDVFFSLGMKR